MQLVALLLFYSQHSRCLNKNCMFFQDLLVHIISLVLLSTLHISKSAILLQILENFEVCPWVASTDIKLIPSFLKSSHLVLELKCIKTQLDKFISTVFLFKEGKLDKNV
jgi:hypothetical protein